MVEFIGGKDVIERIKKAYGFTKQIDLARHLKLPQSTFSTWISRGFFPSELVIRCVKETGARLDYVAYGEDPIFDNSLDMKYFHTIKLENGNTDFGDLIDGDYFVIVENSHLLRYITVLPGGKVRLDGGKFSFECDVGDIEIVGKVILKLEKY